MNGREWIVEAHGCDPVRLGDLEVLRAMFDAMVADLGLHPVGAAQWHQFPSPGGITGMLMLAESHLTVHTFPEHGSLCLNLFCCTPREPWRWELQLARHVSASDVRVRVCEREYDASQRASFATSPAASTVPSHVASDIASYVAPAGVAT